MKVNVNWQPKTNFTGTTSSGYDVFLNGDNNFVAQPAGLASIELVLLGLGSCYTISLIHALRQSKTDIAECRTHVSVNPADSKFDLKNIHLHFDLFGQELSEPTIDRALSLCTKLHCPIAGILIRAGSDISHTFTLHASRSNLPHIDESDSSSLNTQGLHHVALNSTNYEATRKFYTEIMKMHVEWEPDADNVYLTSGNDNLAIHRGDPQDSRLDHIGFILDSEKQVDQWYSYLRDHHVPIEKEPKTHRDGARSFYVVDPDGVNVQLIFHPPLSKRASNS